MPTPTSFRAAILLFLLAGCSNPVGEGTGSSTGAGAGGGSGSASGTTGGRSSTGSAGGASSGGTTASGSGSGLSSSSTTGAVTSSGGGSSSSTAGSSGGSSSATVGSSGCGLNESLCGTGATTCSTDLETDSQNCGVCYWACPANFDCTSGQCCSSGNCNPGCQGTVCPADGGGFCTDLTGDPANCGSCGEACPSGSTWLCIRSHCDNQCENGNPYFSCAAPDGGSTCTDVDWDNANCGYCGNICPSGQTCNSAYCVP